MEDARRGNVGLAPSGHDGAPIASIARINAPVPNGEPRSASRRSPLAFPRGKFIKPRSRLGRNRSNVEADRLVSPEISLLVLITLS